MTEAYNRVRYGEIPETRVEIEMVEPVRQRLRVEGARLQQAREHNQAVGGQGYHL